MMAPTIVLQDGAPEIVLGSGGSNRIRTAILQVISNIVDFHMAGDAAVNSPRVHWENGVFNLEPGFTLPPETSMPFTEQQMQWDEQNMFFGGVHTVLVDASGRLTPVGDRRRSGAIALG
jgi:gamma-glutamyltranspeptidase / glutathione hydrolase